MNPLVSVIIPTLNRRELLQRRSLKSVLGQSFKRWECVIVDDGSSDGTGIWVDEFAKDERRIRYFRNKENMGGSFSRMRGVKEARGRYIVFLDDDNELFPTFLEETLARMAVTNVDAVFTGRIIQYDDYQDVAVPKITSVTAIDWGQLLRKEVFRKVAYDPSVFGDEDADFGIQFWRAGFTASVIEKPLQMAYALKKGEETANTYPNERRLGGLEYFLTKNISAYTDSNERRYVFRLAGRNFYRGGRRLLGLHYFWRSFLAKPNWRTFKHLAAIHGGWRIYDAYMSHTERREASQRLGR